MIGQKKTLRLGRGLIGLILAEKENLESQRDFTIPVIQCLSHFVGPSRARFHLVKDNFLFPTRRTRFRGGLIFARNRVNLCLWAEAIQSNSLECHDIKRQDYPPFRGLPVVWVVKERTSVSQNKTPMSSGVLFTL